MNEPVISFRNFTWKYKSQAEPTLHGLSFDIMKGEKVLICGPSGCGKSTVAHCLNGLIPFSYHGEMEGSLKLLGKETSELSLFDISKITGTVLQDADGQFVGLTVAEDIAFALENDCVSQKELIRRVKETADSVSVGELLHNAPNELSGGQKQRVSLAGVMVDNVPVLLFDEPLANLDPATGKHSIELIDEIQKKTGATVVIIEHRLEDVLWCRVDRVILMSEGRIACDTTPGALLSSKALLTYGIREPLYITALKYAGVKIREEIHPESIRTLSLSGEDCETVRNWFDSIPKPKEREYGGVQLSVSGLDFTYDNGFRALRDMDFSVRKGEMLSIVGKNGAGKSTFSKALCGFVKPQKGKLTLFLDEGKTDMSMLSIKERADHIGYVMQNPNQMISQVMIYDEVALGLRKRGVPEENIRDRVEETLRICGLYPFRNWPVSALSYGQKKRVTIASILVLRPEILILDEPTAGQDYRHYTEIMEFLRILNRTGMTVIMITHDMHLMLEYCERSVVITDGCIIADTTPEAVLTDQRLIEKAFLKETSLYSLAERCGIPDGTAFTRAFIDIENGKREAER